LVQYVVNLDLREQFVAEEIVSEACVPEIEIFFKPVGDVRIVGISEFVAKDNMLWPVRCGLQIEAMRPVGRAVYHKIVVARIAE
jgi:hypothetical protein